MVSGNRKILVYQPVHAWLGLAVVLVLLTTAAYLLFESGIHYSGERVERLTRQLAGTEGSYDALQQANAELREQIAVLKRSSEIDRRATREVRNEYAGLREEAMELRKQLAFYQGIVSPDDARQGLNIQRFHLEPTQEEGGFFYSLTLTQVKRNERYVRGVVEMEVDGLENGKQKVLKFGKLAAGNSKALNFKFRYFQNFEGEIRIPPQFKPLQIRILLKPKGKGQPAGIEETMDWPI
jgi:cell division protein FtsB